MQFTGAMRIINERKEIEMNILLSSCTKTLDEISTRLAESVKEFAEAAAARVNNKKNELKVKKKSKYFFTSFCCSSLLFAVMMRL